MSLTGARVVVQGFGQVGSWAARLAAAIGCKVIAVSDVGGGIYREDGIDVDDALRYKRETGTLVCLGRTDRVTNEELLELDCDVLVPAAIDCVIHKGNAPRIKAKVVLEAANHPLTPEADQILEDRGIPVIPDILVNAGGVIVSYFEWTQNLYQHQWEEKRVNEELDKIMTKAYRTVKDTVDRENLTFRDSAFLIGVERVAHIAKLRGFI